MNPPPLSRWRWALYAAGTAMIAFGVWGQLFGADTNPRRYGELLVVSALAHDLIVAPAVVVLGLLLRRMTRSRLRALVQSTAIVGAGLLLVALPLLVHGRPR